jgi:serine/threonine-protein kinase
MAWDDHDDQQLIRVAEAVLDGHTVDWTVAEAQGGAVGRLAEHLKIVAAVAEASRDGASPEPLLTRDTPPPLRAWGHLRIYERIGRGAFGDVYRAWDPKLDREVALKLIPAAGEASTTSILHEGRLLARVRHPNVVTIYGADHLDGYVGLWMELVPGRTLEEMLQAGTTFEPAEVTRIGVELCRALSAVHAAGLLHRDIKAQNVMRCDDGRVVLMDFGTGRELTEEDLDLAGTPLYLAPEVLQCGLATPQSDIYSLGVLLYHLLTESYPIHGRTIRELRLAHQSGTHVKLHALRGDVPARLAQVIERATEPLPEHRYPTGDMLCAALDDDASVMRRPGLHAPPRFVASMLVAVALLALVVGAMIRDAAPLIDWAEQSFGFGGQLETRMLRVPLQLFNMHGLEVVGEAPRAVDVHVRGFSRALGRIAPGEIVVVLDLSTARSPGGVYSLDVWNVRAPFSAEVLGVTPSSIVIRLDKTLSKVVPVVPSLQGTPAAGFVIGTVRADPATVEVLGAESLLSTVTRAITQPVSVEGKTTSVVEVVEARSPDPAVRLRLTRRVKVSVTITTASKR